MEIVRFYDPEYYPLNPYSAHILEWGWVLYPTLEHAYHTLRYPQKKHQDMILAATSPKQARDISQTLKKYQYEDWSKNNFDIMKQLMQAKAEQHTEVQETLKKSRNMNILKDIPEDSLWWIWHDGKGENIMWKMWEEIREEYI